MDGLEKGSSTYGTGNSQNKAPYIRRIPAFGMGEGICPFCEKEGIENPPRTRLIKGKGITVLNDRQGHAVSHLIIITRAMAVCLKVIQVSDHLLRPWIGRNSPMAINYSRKASPRPRTVYTI